MQIQISNESLPVFEALSSAVRLKIINLLSEKQMNIKSLAKELELSSSIITMHINKLEEAKIIRTERIGHNKISRLQVDQIQILFPEKIFSAYNKIETSLPIGQYNNYSITPTCGLASISDFIGLVDEPKYFMDPSRINASLLWFTVGYLEYQIPNYIEKNRQLKVLEISMEVCSEFPFSNNNWPSDITFSLNGIELGTWTSPGDFSDVRGKYTPKWYPDNLNQYGVLKTIRIMENGCYIEGIPINTNITIKDFQNNIDVWTLKIEVKEDAKNPGGCTLFGKGFGNYDQDIRFKLFYS